MFAAILSCTPSVRAHTVTATYTGTVVWGYLFGTPNSYLNGASYSAVYTFNPALGGTINFPGSSYGGSAFDTMSPSLGAMRQLTAC